jgi:hypothetical protein
MSDSSTSGSKAESGSPSVRALWLAALGGPLAWFLDLVTRYFLVESGRASGHERSVSLVGLAFAVLAVSAGAGSLRNLRRLGGSGAGAELVAALGGGLALLSLLAILAALLPHLFLDPG